MTKQRNEGRHRISGITGIGAQLRRLFGAREGAGAVEFAIVAPLLIVGYLGAYEISVAWSFANKVGRSAATIADAIARRTNVTGAVMDDMTKIASNIMAPYTADNYRLKITGIQVDKDGNATVAWSRDEQRAAPYVKGSPVSLPAAMREPETFIVRAELSLPYRILTLIPGADASGERIFIDRTNFSLERQGKSITCSDCG
ncbi:TadE/TadG family type IV pilus assembly protein [Mycoplana dimorpha]|uniref:Flp pilus assembly protein TadG n=1 Tax=Mycoplana dimorpha TaxID=28320 RepID=A0A2T5BE96_MYCDI|nr:TadE/TadG family type IV pilus assembly protein [Mycoplana dimorpha]PTM97291.1 Flp pilus assembly protein TadG [Mycoplana dimorpha]